MNVFELAAKIAVDSSELKKGLNASETSISGFANKATKTLETLKKVFIGVVSVAAVKKVASGIWNLANATAVMGDRVDKQSQALGMSRKGFQEWDYILAQSGASIDSMGASMRTLNQAILGGSAEASGALKELGLSVENLSSMSQEQAFEETVKALQQLPPGAQKSALAMKLLGRGAQSLMPLLNSSTESVEDLKRNAQQLGLVMSDEAVDASVAFGDALDDLKRSMTAIKNTVGVVFMPALTNSFKAISSYAGKFNGYVRDAIQTGNWKGLFDNIITDVQDAARRLWLRVTDTVPTLWENAQKSLLESDSPILQVIGSLMKDISDAVKYISDHKQDFVDTFNEITGAIGSVVTTGIETIKSVFEWLNEHGIETQEVIKGIIAAFAIIKIVSVAASMNKIVLAIEAIVAAAALIIANWSEIEEFFVTLWNNVSTAVTEAWDAYLVWIDENIIQKVKGAWSDVSTFFTNLWVGLKTKITDAWTAVKKWWTTNIQQEVDKAWGTIKQFFEDIWNGTKDAIVGAWNAVKEWWENDIAGAITSAWDGVKAFFVGIWEGVTGAIQTAIDKVKEFLGLNAKAANVPEQGLITKEMYDSDNPQQAIADALGFDLGDYYAWIETNKAGKPKANGLSFVPENDYLASLHFGEAVLSRNEAEKWRKGQSGDSGAVDLSSLTNAIIVAVKRGMESANIQLDGESVTRHVSRRQAEDIMARRFVTV